MSQNGSTWSSSINTGSDKIVGSGTITFYAIAVDKKGARTQSKSGSINVIACVNAGPTFAKGPSAGDTTVYADPLKTGCGRPIRTLISAMITDIDGVKSATLVFTDQSGRIAQRPMTVSADGITWTSFIDAIVDGTQAGGTIAWQVLAVDGRGAETTSDPQSLQVVRCDSPAEIAASLASPQFDSGTYYWSTCPEAVSVVFVITALDPDSPTGPLQVRISWSMTNPERASRERGAVSALRQRDGSYVARIPLSVTSSWCTSFYGNYNSLSYTVAVTDGFGGTTLAKFEASIHIFSRLTIPLPG
jgi:hypothetical protein